MFDNMNGVELILKIFDIFVGSSLIFLNKKKELFDLIRVGMEFSGLGVE